MTLISDLARRLEGDSFCIGLILRLTALAPDIVEAILHGREPNGLSLAKLTKMLPEDSRWSMHASRQSFSRPVPISP